MKLSRVSIDRFGARSNLSLESLSPELNVVFGPNGSGKSTAIQFIRWMLFGNSGNLYSRYLNPSARSGGRLDTIDRRGQHLSLERLDDGTPYGAFNIRSGSQTTTSNFPTNTDSTNRLMDELRRVTPAEFDTFFEIGDEIESAVEGRVIDHVSAIDRILRLARERGLQFQHVEQNRHEVESLTARLNEYRTQLSRLGLTSMTRSQLEDHRASLHRRIAELNESAQRHRESVEGEYHEVIAELNDKRHHLQQLDEALRGVEDRLQARRLECDEQLRRGEQLRVEVADRQRIKVDQLDQQIRQWREMLDSIRHRVNAIQGSFGSYSHGGESDSLANYHPELYDFLRNVGHSADGIDVDLYESDQFIDHEVMTDHLRGITYAERQRSYRSLLGSALQAMREDVSRLCSHLSSQQNQAARNESKRELDHLRRCETELTQLIDSLSQRRESLVNDPNFGISTSYVTPNYGKFEGYATNCDVQSIYSNAPWWEQPIESQYRHDDLYGKGVWSYDTHGGQHLTKDHAARYYSTPSDYSEPRSALLHQPWSMLGFRVAQVRLQHLEQRSREIASKRLEHERSVQHLEYRLSELESLRNRTHEDLAIRDAHREIEEVENQLLAIHERERLERSILEIEEHIRSLRERVEPSSVLHRASTYLAQITGGALRSIEVRHDDQAWVIDQGGRRIPIHEVPHAAEQIRLCLCLAIVVDYRDRGIELPVILNDTFVCMDNNTVHATVDLLRRLADNGLQLVVFTSQDHVMRMLQERRARSYTLIRRPVTPRPIERRPVQPRPIESRPVIEQEPAYVPRVPVAPVRRPEPTTAPPASTRIEERPTWVAQWHDQRPEDYGRTSSVASHSTSVDYPAQKTRPVSSPAGITNRPTGSPVVSSTSRSFSSSSLSATKATEIEPQHGSRITHESSVTSLHSIDLATQEKLRSRGFDKVGQILDLTDDEFVDELLAHSIDADTARRWYDQILLERFVDLSGIEARILVAGGIVDPGMLAETTSDELMSRIESVFARAGGDSYYGTQRSYDRNSLDRWIRSARSSNWRGRPTSRSRMARAKTPSREHSTVRLSRTDARPRMQRTRDTSTSRSGDHKRTRQTTSPPTVPIDQSNNLRFYLELSDPVVDAPSIGPKTSAYFEAIGVHTVADLLNGKAESMSQRMGQRRVTTELVQRWQTQAELVCRIPNLRGHDAQILEACDVTDPTDLASRDPQSFYKQVSKFIKTSEGKRILRNGKKPDIHEVTSWIEWARSARTLRAA